MSAKYVGLSGSATKSGTVPSLPPSTTIASEPSMFVRLPLAMHPHRAFIELNLGRHVEPMVVDTVVAQSIAKAMTMSCIVASSGHVGGHAVPLLAWSVMRHVWSTFVSPE